MGNRATLSGGVVVEYWDYDGVRAALRAAGVVLGRLRVSGCGPAGFRTATPTPVRSRDESYGWDVARARAPLPGPAEISLLDQVSAWIAGVADRERRLALWALVLGKSLRWLGARLGCSHTTAATLQRAAVRGLVLTLNRR